jgi:fucose 4-O-acetylase-like acetyltransferase
MKRDLKLDNLKGLAMLLVIFGHFFEQTMLVDMPIPYFIYICRCILCMPIFIFVSGYLSKIEPNTSTKAFKNILIPYFLFSTLWIIFSFFKDGDLSFVSYFLPAAGLWYLLCLFFWRTFLPGINTIKYALLVSLVPAMYLGTLSFKLTFLSISQTICFLPIFLFGFYFKQMKEKIQIKNIYFAVIGFFLLLFLFAYIIQDHGALLCFQYSYQRLGLTNQDGALLTLFSLIMTMIVLIFLFYSMTNRKSFLTQIGRNSLIVYVFHFYIFLSIPNILQYMGLTYLLDNFYFSVLYVVLSPFIIAYVLSRDKLAEWVNKLLLIFTNIITGNISILKRESKIE